MMIAIAPRGRPAVEREILVAKQQLEGLKTGRGFFNSQFKVSNNLKLNPSTLHTLQGTY